MTEAQTARTVALDDMRQFLELVWEAGDVREFRAPKHNRYAQTASGYFDSPEAFLASAAQWDGRANCHLTLNPVRPALLSRAVNRILPRSAHASADADMLRRRWRFLDIDACRPSGISSKDEELAAAWEVLDRAVAYLRENAWPEPLVAMSVNRRGH